MIKSDKDLVASIGSSIKSSASTAELANVSQASDTDVPVHIDCVNSYIKSQSALDKLRDIMERDADNIVVAAEKFSEVDTKLATQLNQIPTASRGPVTGSGGSYADTYAD